MIASRHLCAALCGLLALAVQLSLASPQPNRRQSEKAGYLFVHFYDNYKSPGVYDTYPAGEQVFAHISEGNDPLAYRPLNDGAPLLTSDVGTKAVRDMYLVSKPDESQHFIIATDLNQTAVGGFSGRFLSTSLVIWESQGASLSKWKPARLVQVVPPEFRVSLVRHAPRRPATPILYAAVFPLLEKTRQAWGVNPLPLR